MHGNVWERVEDSWHDAYRSAPTDGSPPIIVFGVSDKPDDADAERFLRTPHLRERRSKKLR
jgi:formylglycine-generating enzyme required for sulfatase activity